MIRARQASSYLLIFLLLAISLAAFVDQRALVWLSAAALLGLVLAKREWDLLPVALLFFLMYVASGFYPAAWWRIPTLPFLVPLALLFWLDRLRVPGDFFSWARRGELSQVVVVLIALVSLFSAVALVLWALWANYLGAGEAFVRSLHFPHWFLFLVGIPLFALLNAVAEECVYRGVLLEGLSRRFAPPLALALQASAFASAHVVSGFPNGKLGYLMTFTYALLLGHLRLRSRGMLAPILAHIVADLVIGTTLLLLVL